MVAALLLMSSMAMADVPPPRGYVETCTVEIQCGDIPGKQCSGWHGGRESCEALEKDSWVRMCKTFGASSWDEVFCKTKPEASVVEAREKAAKSGCGCQAVGAVSILPMGIAGLLVLFRREVGGEG